MTWTDDLNPLEPLSDGPAGQGDDYLRTLHTTLVTTWPDLGPLITMGTAGAAPTSADVTALWDTLASLAGGVAGVFAPGMIMMWSTATGAIPTDWTICNGGDVNGVAVPDLRDKFIIGAGLTYGDGSAGGSAGDQQTGIAGTHQHTIPNPTIVMGNLPSNLADNISVTLAQTAADANHQDDQYVAGGDDGAAGTVSRAAPITVAQANSDDLVIDDAVTAGNHTHSIPVEIPPYYALTYIIYVGPTP
jgi:hypothetical protein